MRNLSTFFRRRRFADGPLGLALAALVLAAPGLRAQTAVLTVPELVDKTMREGEDSYLPARTARDLRLPKRDYGAKELEVPQELCEDGLNRHFAVILTGGKKPRPKHLWWHTITTGPKLSGSFDFRASLTGRLVEATRTYGILDSEGNVIQAPGIVKPLNTRDPEVLARFQKELDFWLQGRGRRKAKKAAR